VAGAEAEMYRCEILNKGRAGTLAFACKKGAKRTISDIGLKRCCLVCMVIYMISTGTWNKELLQSAWHSQHVGII